jgi:peptide/nickel transport system substrate-binding protein
LQWIQKPPQGKVSPRAAALSAIDSIDLPDPRTVRIKMSRPTPSLMMSLASHYFAIGQAKDILANGEVGPRLIGTGPFKLKSYQRSNTIELEKNPAYFIPGRPYLDGLKYFIISDYNTALTNFIAGQYDLFWDTVFIASDVERIRSEAGGNVEIVMVKSYSREPVFMNARRKPYDDIRVRQGDAVRGGYMAPGGQWAIPESDLRKFSGYDRPNLDEVKRLLSAAGVATPFDASMTTRTDFKDYAEFVKDQLGRLGINIHLTLADTATAQPVLQRGDFDIGPWVVSINTDDPDAVFSEISTSNAVRNWSAVKDPEIDALYEKQSQTFDFNERKKIVQDLERRALSQYQVAVLYFERHHHAFFKRVRNFVPHESLYTNRRMEAVWLSA